MVPMMGFEAGTMAPGGFGSAGNLKTPSISPVT
jgi:hypothetical protein